MSKHSIRVQLKGCTFKDMPDHLAWLRQHPDTPAWLEREPDCIYDPNAVRVMINRGTPVCIGYLAKDLAAVIAPVLDAKRPVTILRVQPTGGVPGKHQGCVADLDWD